MHCFLNSLQKKMPFISGWSQTIGQEGEGHAALMLTLQRKSLLGMCCCLGVFNIKCKSSVSGSSPQTGLIPEEAGACQGFPCPDSVDRFCSLKFSSKRSYLIPAASSSPCVNRAMAHRHRKPRFPWPSSIFWFLSEANNQTPPDEECIYLGSCRNQSRKKGGWENPILVFAVELRAALWSLADHISGPGHIPRPLHDLGRSCIFSSISALVVFLDFSSLSFPHISYYYKECILDRLVLVTKWKIMLLKSVFVMKYCKVHYLEIRWHLLYPYIYIYRHINVHRYTDRWASLMVQW